MSEQEIKEAIKEQIQLFQVTDQTINQTVDNIYNISINNGTTKSTGDSSSAML